MELRSEERRRWRATRGKTECSEMLPLEFIKRSEPTGIAWSNEPREGAVKASEWRCDRDAGVGGYEYPDFIGF